MVSILRKLFPCLCIATGVMFAQEQAPPQPAPAAAPPAAPQQPVVKPPAEVKPASQPEIRYSGSGVTAVGLQYWFNPTNPVMRTGKAHSTTNPSDLDFPGNVKPSPGAELDFNVGNHHTLQLSYFQTRGHGNTVARGPLDIFGVGYNQGDYLSAGYKLQHGKAMLDYLSWPFPLNNARFRVKTLWGVQYTSIKASMDAPLKPKTDADGEPVTTFGETSRWFIYPSLGMGLEYLISKNVRWELKASGFGLPGHAAAVDAVTFLAIRGLHWEIQFGGKGFYFKTTPHKEELFRGTLSGGFVGMRWYP